MSLVRCPGDQCHILLTALPGHPVSGASFSETPLSAGACPRAGLCRQHHVGMLRDSGRLPTHSREEALVLSWLLRVLLHCLGPIPAAWKGLWLGECEPSAGARLSVLCRARHGAAREPFPPDTCSPVLLGRRKPSGLAVLSAEQKEARAEEGVIEAPIVELSPLSSWLCQAELCWIHGKLPQFPSMRSLSTNVCLWGCGCGQRGLRNESSHREEPMGLQGG